MPVPASPYTLIDSPPPPLPDKNGGIVSYTPARRQQAVVHFWSHVACEAVCLISAPPTPPVCPMDMRRVVSVSGLCVSEGVCQEDCVLGRGGGRGVVLWVREECCATAHTCRWVPSARCHQAQPSGTSKTLPLGRRACFPPPAGGRRLGSTIKKICDFAQKPSTPQDSPHRPHLTNNCHTTPHRPALNTRVEDNFASEMPQ